MVERCALCDGQRWVRYGNGEDRPCSNCNEQVPRPRLLTVGSLFSGIEGLGLGLERAGHRIIWNCEIDPYASKVLKRHWPTVPNLGDITKVDWSSVERPDVLTGGYPCPAFSQAARGRNVAADLWPHMRTAIACLRHPFPRRRRRRAPSADDLLQPLDPRPLHHRRGTLIRSRRGGRQQRTAGVVRVTHPRSTRRQPTIPHRTRGLRALGNAVVPPVAEMIGRRLACLSSKETC